MALPFEAWGSGCIRGRRRTTSISPPSPPTKAGMGNCFMSATSPRAFRHSPVSLSCRTRGPRACRRRTGEGWTRFLVFLQCLSKGITRVGLLWEFFRRCIQPMKQRAHDMFEYSEPQDPTRESLEELADSEVHACVRSCLAGNAEVMLGHHLEALHSTNPPNLVSIILIACSFGSMPFLPTFVVTPFATNTIFSFL